MDMETVTTTHIMNPIMQYGFAGLSVVLLIILVWLIRELLKILKDNNDVIEKNTAAIRAVDEHSKSTLSVAIECKDELFKRPCIAKFNIGKSSND
jgi:p-aminobenzoyl-glutamate transporter AbgT